ncbi:MULTISPECIES: DUF4376 domain-containing protein [Trichocoleus]|uniref:DUF4376 domain-containing protein n=1 Tax=Trichocoleus desertorum GB2-A4 TaxID=2933944 RepID=A0ABV0JEL5_9CYAN|nr:DUF4376 domain-containing protein [Trichocoleus sp. FACHB-46]MBD1864177.1 DUF4376 domain-containing protein [Trichocoleus sp. FACHB-46]
MKFQHHPDNFIYLNDLRLPLEVFQKQEPDYSLPKGATHRLYTGDRHLLYSKDSQWAGEVPWQEGDRYLANIAKYQADWEARLAARLEPSPTTVEEARTYIGGKINTLRIEKEQAGVVWNSHPVQTRPMDVNNLNAEVLATQTGARQDGEIWRMGNNENIFLTNAQLLEMAAAVRTHVKRCYGAAWQHKAVIEQLHTVNEILSYNFQRGWP